MNFDLKRSRIWAPPIIRGFTSDSERALIVTTLENQGGELVLSKEVTIEGWREEYTTFVKKYERYPHSVAIEGESWAMALGLSYDEALKASGVSKNPFEGADTRRSTIMRGKIALVTGAAQGFGEGIVRHLVDEGSYVYIADLNFEGAQLLAKQLNSEKEETVAFAVEVNVTSEESVEKMVNYVASTTGALDLFVSNAGVLKAGSVKEMALKDFQFVTDVDYTGFFICTKYASRQLALQHLAAQNHFSDIVVISSKSGLEGSNRNGAYAGAKFGVIGLAQSFALELVEDNIKVNAVCPGNFFDGPLWSDPVTGLFQQYLRENKVPGAKTVSDVQKAYEAKIPLKRGCRTLDVARAIYYIVEQKYETGQAVPVTGGQVMLN